MTKSKSSDKTAGSKKADSTEHSNANSAAESTTAESPDAKTAKAEQAQDAAKGADSSSDSAESDAVTDSTADAAESEAETKDPLADKSDEELRDMVRRTAAERDNIARRAMNELHKARRIALNNFAKGVCEVCDSLQAALTTAADAENQNMREGVELTLRKLLATMESNGIHPVRPDVGAAFDTSLHEAIGVNNEADKTANTVAQVVRAGYTLDGQVVRAAQVIVYQPGK